MAGTAVAGVRVGHWSDHHARTGCTVVTLPPEGAVTGVEVRGSAPGTRETDLLRPGMLVGRAHALMLCGGSAFGLASADGAMRYLRERGVGVAAGPARVPIVPAAVIFDLGEGRPDAHPGPDAGYAACLDAERGGEVEEGAVGAGTGATVGKLLGPQGRSAGGFGAAALSVPGGGNVVALAVVNALGDIVDASGRVLAGARAEDGSHADGWAHLLANPLRTAPPVATNTTIAVLATDVALTSVQCRKLAELGQDGLAQAIRPVHTMFDGDTVFAASAGAVHADMLNLGACAVEAMVVAIRRAVRRG
jgi:L-aminopeptidase/D-esterase-like protein